jgi:phosphoribosylformimino-5-aminoimidazole carboxamide ribotide isomerase
MEIIPAIDLRAGRVVRLAQGDYQRETRYDSDPLELARRYEGGGARSLHVVDLDGARDGRFENLRAIEAIAAGTGLRLQSGGGIRDAAALARIFDAGVARAVIGSLAVRAPETVKEWLGRYGAERIVLAFDVRDRGGLWEIAQHGWVEGSGVSLDAAIASFRDAGLRRVLCTDIARDGMLGGPNLELYRELGRRAPWLRVQASGGVGSLIDLARLKDLGVSGVIVGKALLEGRFTLEEALAC